MISGPLKTIVEKVGTRKFLDWKSRCSCKMTIVFMVCCLLVCQVAIAGADDGFGHVASSRWNIQSLMQSFAQVKTDNPHFVQRQYLHDLSKPLVSKGILIYKAPDYLEQKTEFPSPQRAVIRGDRLTLYSSSWHGPRNISLQNTPGIWAVVESLRATLSGQLSILQRYFTVQMNGAPGGWRLELKQRFQTPKKEVVSILISGRDARINRIEIHYSKGNYSIMKLRRNAP